MLVASLPLSNHRKLNINAPSKQTLFDYRTVSKIKLNDAKALRDTVLGNGPALVMGSFRGNGNEQMTDATSLTSPSPLAAM